MTRFVLILALSGLSMGSLTGFSGRKGGQQSDFAGIDNKPLSLSVSCSSLETECDGYCIPSTGECCSYGDGSYCETGDYCTSGGCCEDGEICTGEATGCDEGKELCGDYCIPEGSVCCTDGSYCDSGETCTSDGFCTTGGDSSSENATETTQPTSTSTNGNDDGDDDDQGHTLCARKSRGGGSDSTDDADDGDSDCGNDGAGSILTPNLAGTLLAVVILLL
ncbi:hypothetical protein BGZ61DRAFT_465070 [Ilyonectria robusta]|uniref:uncharacterized protein n=1 Tax=Ilyonectria robusta TaxID=1079257 RepID=UPI001E8DB144|nr:uncharacterized protein BGZ61DRAFT_465070 [Ilyonectria robusta]KAH8659754.1 hypothetical protein BGZ61DRAFT_465070 [Ilyonectria robusta]